MSDQLIHNPIQLGTLANADCDVLGSTTLRYRCQVAFGSHAAEHRKVIAPPILGRE